MKTLLLFQTCVRMNRTIASRVCAVLALVAFSISSYAQGPGNNLAFTGTQYVTLSSTTLSGSYTKEAWVYWTGTGTAGNFYNILSGQNSAFWVNNGLLSAGHNNNFTEIQDLNPFVNKVLIKKNYSKQKFNPSLTNEVVISDREKEVLTLVCMEFTAAEIAQKMDISARTVEAIKDRLMERFGVKNSVGLVFYAMKNQLID